MHNTDIRGKSPVTKNQAVRGANTVPAAAAVAFICPQSLRNGEYSTCLGAGCMAWRFVEPARPRLRICDNPTATTEPDRPLGVPPMWLWRPYDEDDEPAAWVELLVDAQARRRGFCGMAGRPESPTDELFECWPEIFERIREACK